VCVFISNEDYHGPAATAPPEERAELARLHREGQEAKMSTGSVHTWLLSPDGKLQLSQHIAEAAKPAKLLASLEAMKTKYPVPAGPPAVPPRALSRPAKLAPGSVAVHVTARREGRGSWGEFPGENWPVFTENEWKSLLTVPPGKKPGDTWQIDHTLSRRLLNHFHPQTEDCSDIDRNDLQTATLTARLEKSDTISLSGQVKLRRSFYPGRNDLTECSASLEGFIRDGRLMLVTLDDARFGKEKFFAAAVGERR
jgi:hypothetical protein